MNFITSAIAQEMPESSSLTNATGAVTASPGNGSVEADIRDIFEPQSPPWNWDWWYYVLVGVLVLGVLWALWRLWIWYSIREKAVQPEAKGPVVAPVRIDPAEKARRRIQEAFNLISQPEPYCVEVSAALRIYLEERLALKAPERTTEEFLQEIRWSNRLHADQKARLEQFLEICDLVKFAKQNPDRNTLSEIGDVAVALIQEIEREENHSLGDKEAQKGGQS